MVLVSLNAWKLNSIQWQLFYRKKRILQEWIACKILWNTKPVVNSIKIKIRHWADWCEFKKHRQWKTFWTDFRKTKLFGKFIFLWTTISILCFLASIHRLLLVITGLFCWRILFWFVTVVMTRKHYINDSYPSLSHTHLSPLFSTATHPLHTLQRASGIGVGSYK